MEDNLTLDESMKPKADLQADDKTTSQDDILKKAHDEAEADMEQDAELSSEPGQGDDLDEGELAQLEGED